MKNKINYFKTFTIYMVWIWFTVFALVPICLIFVTSFITYDTSYIINFSFTTKNYLDTIKSIYGLTLIRSIMLAFNTTAICLIVGYPFAFIISSSRSKYKSLLLLLVIIPFWTSTLIRTYAIIVILKAKGILNSLLFTIGIINQPLQVLYSYTAVLIGTIYDLLPFMIIPLYASMEKLNPEYIEAAKDLGANKFTTYVKIIIPLTMQGIITGCLLVFLPAMTMFYIPILLGGAKDMLLGNLIEYQFLVANNWPLGTAISVVLSILIGLIIILSWSNTKEKNHKILL